MPKHKLPLRKVFLISLLIMTLIVVSGFFVINYFLTSDHATKLVNERGSRGLGRDLSVADIDIDWDWRTPRVQISHFKMANAPDFKDAEMVNIEKIDFRIHIWKLLLGRAEFDHLALTKPHIILEKTADGKKNWKFPMFSGEAVAADAALPDNRHDFPVIGSFLITDGVLIYRDPAKDLDLELSLNTAEGSSEGSKPIRIDGQGTMQKQAFDVHAEGGSLDILRDSGQDFPLTLEMTMGPTQISLQGTFKDPVQLTGIDATLAIKGNSMADLFYLTMIPLPPTPPYTLSGKLGKESDVWAFNGFKGVVGDSDLSGDLSYDTGKERGHLKGKLYSQRMDMDDLGGFVGMAPSTGAGETAAPEQKQQAAAEKASPKLIPDTTLNVARLRASDLDVTLHIDKLEAPHIPFKGGDVRFLLENGLLTLDPLRLTLANGTTAGSLIVDAREDVPQVKMNMDFKKLQLSPFFAGTRFEEGSEGHFGGNVTLAGNGLSLADVMADADGRAVLMMDGGQISLLLMEAADIDIAEAMPLLLGEDKTTRIRCGVTDFKITDGILNSQIVVLDTTDTNLQGRVDINLKNETIDAVFDAQSKDMSLLSLQSPVTVTGRLKKPSVMLQPVESGLRVGAAAVLGVVLTPLAAIIPFLEPGLGEDSPCNAILKEARKS